MKIGYIVRYDLDMNPHLTERFEFREAAGLIGQIKQTQKSMTLSPDELCKELDRHFVGIEIDLQCYNIAQNRSVG